MSIVFQLAYEKFSLGLELLDSEVFLSQSKNRRLRHKLFILRAETLLKLERYEEAVKDATEAIRFEFLLNRYIFTFLANLDFWGFLMVIVYVYSGNLKMYEKKSIIFRICT